MSMTLHRLVAWMRVCMLRVTPHAVLRRIFHTPPSYPSHVPIVLHRQGAAGGDARTGWVNAVRAAHAVQQAYPHDVIVASYVRRVVTTYAALFC